MCKAASGGWAPFLWASFLKWGSESTFNVGLHLFIKDRRAFVLHHNWDSPGWKLLHLNFALQKSWVQPGCGFSALQLSRIVNLQLRHSQRKEQKGKLSWSWVSAVPGNLGCCPLQGKGHGDLEECPPSGLLHWHFKGSWDSKQGRNHFPLKT